MKRQFLAITLALIIASPAIAAPINLTPTTSPVPTQVKYVSPIIQATGSGGSGSRISPGITNALSGKTLGEYRVSSTQSVTWDGTKITASTRYVGTKVIQEVFTGP